MPPVEQADVVVIGAGIAGLATARSLVAAGLDVIVLEARDRVGGRLLSRPTPGGSLDIGATWFWPNEPRIGELVRALGLRTHAQHLAGDALFQDQSGVQRIRGNPIDGVAGSFSAGAQELAQALVSELPQGTVKLSQVVNHIDATADRVIARSATGSFSGRQVVIALPPALAVARIEFLPGLSVEVTKLAERTPVWMGAITKVVAQYSETFWRDRGLAGACISHVGPMREIHDMSGPDGDPAALFGFVPPIAAGAPTVGSDEVLRQLVQIFGQAAAHPEELVIQDWRRERHTSPEGVETLQDYALFGHAVYAHPILGGTVHWASTETASQYAGHIEGALVASERAVREVGVALNR